MTTSGNYSFTFDAGELVTEAAERAGLDPSRLSNRHMISMRRSLNLILQNLEIKATDSEYRVDRVTQSLATGVRAYELPVGTIDVLDLVVTDTASTGSYWNPDRTTREDYMRLERTNQQNSSPSLWWVSRELPLTDLLNWRLRSFLSIPRMSLGMTTPARRGRFFEP